MSTPSAYTLPFLRKEQVAKDTYSFYFDRSQAGVDFTAGQYARMILEHPTPDDRGTRRLVTIASSPLQKEFQMHTTKVVEKSSTFKKFLFNLTPGQEVNFFGPLGDFVLPENTERPLVFLAGGIGITPFHSMILYAHAAKLEHTITLFVSFSTAEEVVFYEELRKIEAENEKIKVIYTVTHPEASLQLWDGETGRVSEELIKKYLPDLHQPSYYISGPPVMVDALHTTITALQVPEEQVKTEQFTGY